MKDPQRESDTEFSVIIPALNEERVIGRTLEALVGMAYPRRAFEVIVVDNGSVDGTRKVVESYRASLPLTLLEKAGVHVSALRNLGAAAARGRYLAFLDADMVVPANWLAEAQAFFAARGACVIGAPPRVPDGSSWVARTWHQSRRKTKAEPVSYVASGNLLIDRVKFRALGAFDETLETNEDCEFCFRARAAGLSIFALPPIAPFHLGVPQTLREFFVNERWHGKDVFKVFLRDPLAFQNPRAVMFASYVAVCVVGAIGGLGAAVAWGSYAPLAAAVVATLLAPVALSLRAVLAGRQWTLVLPLASLYFVYGLARAACLLGAWGPLSSNNTRALAGRGPASGGRAGAGQATELAGR